jgi:hypothetical protein
MPRYIPDCPTFARINVGGVDHTITPSPQSVDSFLASALRAQGLRHWHDAGATSAIMPAIEAWWPEEPCPVATTIANEDDAAIEDYRRWHNVHLMVNATYGGGRYGGGRFTLEDAIAAYPEDADDLRKLYAWCQRCRDRFAAIHAVKSAIEAMGSARRQHVLDQVVADLDREMPGFVRQCVESHCADGHMCSRAEHDLV